MKKNLWVLGLAVAALTSCTQSEVVDIPEGRAIGFTTHVDNGSRSTLTDVNKASIDEFHVFGYTRDIPSEGEPTGAFGELLANEPVTLSGDVWTYANIKYWEPYTQYRFAAYANGLNEAHLNVEEMDNVVGYSAENDVLTFTNYVAVGNNDLVAAISGDIKTGASITSPEVPFSFSHMLSKIAFSFYGNTSTTLKISDVTINNAVVKGTGTYTYGATDDPINWTPETSTSTYTSNNTENQLSSTVTRYVFYVIPQSNTNLTVTFNIKSYDSQGIKIDDNTYSASLKTTATGHEGVWHEGYVYEYYTSFGQDYEEIPIEFTVKAVEGWKPATDTQGVELKPALVKQS